MADAVPDARGSLRIPRRNFPYYGQSVGIIMLDTANIDVHDAAVTGGAAVNLEGFTRIPGDVGNATTFSFPVQYKLVGAGLSVNDLVSDSPTQAGIDAVVQASKELESDGVKAIATTCGLFAFFQQHMSEAVEIPVYASAVLQVPLVSMLIGKNRKVGIITANGAILSDRAHLEPMGVDDSVPHVVWGIEDRPQEENFWIFDELDPDKRREALEKPLTLTATRMMEAHPDIGAIVLECTNTPPAAHAIQQATGMPVFDVVTMLEWANLGVNQTRHTGAM